MTFAFKLHRAALTEAARRAVTVTGMVTVPGSSESGPGLVLETIMSRCVTHVRQQAAGRARILSRNLT